MKLPIVGMFRCEKLSCTLSTKSCGARYAKAEEEIFVDINGELTAHPMVPCRGCAIGSEHAKVVA